MGCCLAQIVAGAPDIDGQGVAAIGVSESLLRAAFLAFHPALLSKI